MAISGCYTVIYLQSRCSIITKKKYFFHNQSIDRLLDQNRHICILIEVDYNGNNSDNDDKRKNINLHLNSIDCFRKTNIYYLNLSFGFFCRIYYASYLFRACTCHIFLIYVIENVSLDEINKKSGTICSIQLKKKFLKLPNI